MFVGANCGSSKVVVVVLVIEGKMKGPMYSIPEEGDGREREVEEKKLS